jgi:hypothetical protein
MTTMKYCSSINFKLSSLPLLQLKCKDIADKKITLNKFPVIMGRGTPPLKALKKIRATLCKRLSRTHAEISIKKDRYYIKDLKSRNGTLVNNKKIKRLTRLKNKDLISFQNSFTFEVVIPEEKKQNGWLKNLKEKKALEAKQEKSKEEQLVADLEADSETLYLDPSNMQVKGAKDFVGNIAGIQQTNWQDQPLNNIHPEASDTSIRKNKASFSKIFTIILALVIISGLGWGIFVWSKPARIKMNIDSLAREKQYIQVIENAEFFLGTYSHEPEVIKSWWISQLNIYAKEWKTLWDSNQLDSLHQKVENLRQKAISLGIKNQEQLDFIIWTLDTEKYYRSRKVKTLFKDEQIIISFLDQFNKLRKDKLLGQKMLAGLPALSFIENSADRRRMQLWNESSLFTQNVAKLNNELTIFLENRNQTKAKAILARYHSLQVSGIEPLEADYKKWQKTIILLEKENYLQAFIQVNSTTVETPIFSRVMDKLKKELLPFAASKQQFAMAKLKWQEGECKQGIDILSQIAKNSNDAELNQELCRQKNIYNQYLWVKANKGSSNYNIRLIKLFHQLDKNIDQVIYKNLKNAYNRASRSIQAEADREFRSGKKLFKKYNKSPLTSKAILTSTKSNSFEKKIKFLTRAKKSLAEARSKYHLLQKKNRILDKTAKSVQNELERQKNNLTNAKLLISETEYDKMLKALGNK